MLKCTWIKDYGAQSNPIALLQLTFTRKQDPNSVYLSKHLQPFTFNSKSTYVFYFIFIHNFALEGPYGSFTNFAIQICTFRKTFNMQAKGITMTEKEQNRFHIEQIVRKTYTPPQVGILSKSLSSVDTPKNLTRKRLHPKSPLNGTQLFPPQHVPVEPLPLRRGISRFSFCLGVRQSVGSVVPQ